MSHIDLNPPKNRLIPVLLDAEQIVIWLIIAISFAIFLADILR